MIDQGTLNLVDCTLSNNIATRPGDVATGGAILNVGTLTATNCTFSYNIARGSTAFGGAIDNAGAVRLVNCSFYGNRVVPDGSYDSGSGFGGAIYTFGP